MREGIASNGSDASALSTALGDCSLDGSESFPGGEKTRFEIRSVCQLGADEDNITDSLLEDFQEIEFDFRFEYRAPLGIVAFHTEFLSTGIDADYVPILNTRTSAVKCQIKSLSPSKLICKSWESMQIALDSGKR